MSMNFGMKVQMRPLRLNPDGFEEASNIMFGDGEYDYMDWKLISVNGHVSF